MVVWIFLPHAVDQDHHQCGHGHSPIVNRPVQVGEQPIGSIGSGVGDASHQDAALAAVIEPAQGYRAGEELQKRPCPEHKGKDLSSL